MIIVRFRTINIQVNSINSPLKIFYPQMQIYKTDYFREIKIFRHLSLTHNNSNTGFDSL